ncbi:MAG: Co2+/Mg2+ efflux protein ApaG [Bacteroidota bacterium]
MNTKITEGIKITVQPTYNTKLSFVEENSYVFEYFITIQNSNSDKVQLLSREWYVYDSLGEPSTIKGLGVIGEQPILNFNESHSYKSYSELKSEMGYMEGFYTFINLITNKKFKVSIPRFMLIFPGKLN